VIGIRVLCSDTGTGVLANYWTGLANTTAGWRWPDGTMTTGYVSNADPYSHWYNDFGDLMSANDCIYARLLQPYSK
jgi:hypothetical protein